MATAKVAMLREEMGRCMRELNTLRIEELEAELLGSSFGAKKGGGFLGTDNGSGKRGRGDDERVHYGGPERSAKRHSAAREFGFKRVHQGDDVQRVLGNNKRHRGPEHGGADVDGNGDQNDVPAEEMDFRRQGYGGMDEDDGIAGDGSSNGQDPSNMIWDGVAELSNMCISAPVGGLRSDINNLLSVLGTGGFNSTVLGYLDASIRIVLVKADALLGNAAISFYKKELIRREKEGFIQLCANIKANMDSFTDRYKKCVRLSLSETPVDEFTLPKNFSDCNMDFKTLMTISNGHEDDLCNMSLMITRNTMQMTTQLLQFMCMLELLEHHSQGS
jgi:hypothetical protein